MDPFNCASYHMKFRYLFLTAICPEMDDLRKTNNTIMLTSSVKHECSVRSEGGNRLNRFGEIIRNR